jgi:hypothetical protein
MNCSINTIVLSGVSMLIPVGAIGEGIQQEIYFKVFQDGSNIVSCNVKQGRRILTPVVECGPHGFQFLKPIRLDLPHCAGKEAHELALMLHGASQSKLLDESNTIDIVTRSLSI